MPLSTQHPGHWPQTLVEVRPEGLPPNLLLAKEAIEQEDFRRAKALLDGTTIEQGQLMISQDSSREDVMAMVGLMFMRLRQWHKAEPWFRDLIRQRPNPLALQQLAEICYLTGRFCQATAYRKQAMDLDPDDVEIWVAYGLDLTREGRIDEGLALLRRVLDRCPHHAEAHSKLLFFLHFVPGQDRKRLLEEHRQWGRLHAPLSLARRDHLREPDPDRRLRIGYLSADFRTHSVAYTFEALLDHHDR